MTKFKQGLHNHSTFSDGDNTVEDMILGAISKGFDAFGISEHSYTAFDLECCMAKGSLENYLTECDRLKEKYEGQIDVLCGLELDYYSPTTREGLDYAIGSVHYLYKNGEYIAIDDTPEKLIDGTIKHYSGDIYALCEDYFATVAKVTDKTDCDIIGHFDIIKKFSEKVPDLIDTANPRYIIARDRAIKKLVETGRIFEVNTGAMSRGYKSEPYPERSALEMIASLGGKVTISADSHSVDTIDYGYDEVLEIIRECGFKEVWIYRDGGFKPSPV